MIEEEVHKRAKNCISGESIDSIKELGLTDEFSEEIPKKPLMYSVLNEAKCESFMNGQKEKVFFKRETINGKQHISLVIAVKGEGSDCDSKVYELDSFEFPEGGLLPQLKDTNQTLREYFTEKFSLENEECINLKFGDVLAYPKDKENVVPFHPDAGSHLTALGGLPVISEDQKTIIIDPQSSVFDHSYRYHPLYKECVNCK